MRQTELLAPAGNAETALAAFDAGADAVYCGLGRFNARERAENFTADSLGRVIEHFHNHGKKVYLAFNTLLKEQELSEAAEQLALAAKLAPDALIIQDLGVLAMAKEYFPSLALHASTQMGIHNSAGVAAAAWLGFSRVILERQLTLDELRLIAKRSEIELEVFIHGSLCCSLSGRCLLSSSQGGWSGNRGKCKQPCRRPYRVAGKEGFFLSPADLEGISLLPELRKMGIASLKIEGRLRGPEYVWKTVRAYRLLLDGPVDSPPELMAEAEQLLRSTSTRRASRGFYFGREWPSLIEPSRSGSFGVPVGAVEKRTAAGIMITASGRLHLGDRLRLGETGESFTLIALKEQDRNVIKVRSGSRCFIPGSFDPGSTTLYKVGENGFDFTRRAAALPERRIPLSVHLKLSSEEWMGRVEGVEESWRAVVAFAPPRNRAFDSAEAEREFAAGVPAPWKADKVQLECTGEFFVPASELKRLRREFWDWAAARLSPKQFEATFDEALRRFREEYALLPGQIPPFPEEKLMRLPGFQPERELTNLPEGAFVIGGLHELELVRKSGGKACVAAPPLPVCNSLAAKLLKGQGVRAVIPFPELDAASLEAFRAKSPLPLLPETEEVPLLVTRLPLPEGVWAERGGAAFRVVRKDGLCKLYGMHPFEAKEWK